MKAACIVFLVFGALPLLLYPFVLLANVMSLAGPRTGAEPLGQTLVSFAFLGATTAYPLAYLLFLVLSVVRLKQGRLQPALIWSLAPMGYLVGVVLLLLLWMATS